MIELHQVQRRDRLRWLAIFLMALTVRVLMIVWSVSQFYSVPPTGMSDLYFRQGYAIAGGLGYVVGSNEADDFLEDIQRKVDSGGFAATPETVGPAPKGLYPDTLHPPGMSLLVAAIHKITGLPADVAVQVLGALLDSLAAVLVCWIGTKVAGARVGVASGVLYALFLPQAWAATGAQMPDGLIGFFVVAMLAAYLKALETDGSRAYAWYATAGLALGVGSYLRPDYLLVPVALFPFVWACRRSLLPAAAGSLTVLIAAFLVLSPWAYRNHVIYDRWIFTSSGAGATMVTGLAGFENPWGFGATDVHRHEEAHALGLVSAWVPEADEHFRHVWWQAVSSDPMSFVQSMIKRLPLALAPPFEFGFDNPLKTGTFTDRRAAGEDRYDVIRRSPMYVLGAYWDNLLMATLSGVALLASLVWLVLDYRRWALVLLVLAPHLYSIATHVIVHIEPRFLLPSMFGLLIGSAYVLVNKSGWLIGPARRGA